MPSLVICCVSPAGSNLDLHLMLIVTLKRGSFDFVTFLLLTIIGRLSFFCIDFEVVRLAWVSM